MNTTTRDQPFSEQVPPQNLEAEQSVLGACLIDGEAAQGAAEILKPGDFYADKHGCIFDCVLTVLGRGDPVDLITIQTELRTRVKLDNIGGLTYLTSLMNLVPTTANVTTYAKLVAESAMRRRFITTARQAIATAEEENRPLDEARAILAPALRTPSKDRRLITAAEVESRPPQEYLVDRWLPAGAFAVIYGAPGTGKSLLMVDLAASVALGRPWMRNTTTQGTVAYISAEGASGLGRRLEAWRTARRVEQIDNLFFLEEGINLADPGAVGQFLAMLMALPKAPSLIVADTLARTFIGDENSVKDISAFIAGVDRIRAETSCTFIAVHHAAKNGLAERGSSALRGAVDVLLSVTSEDDRLRLEVQKMKDGEPPKPLFVELQPYALSVVPFLANLLPKRMGVTVTQRRALEALANFPEGATHATWISAAGMPNSSFARALGNLLDREYVRAEGPGRSKTYVITEEAKALLP